MTLLEVAENLHSLDNSETIFAKRNPAWSETSEAILCETSATDSVPAESEGFEYFLEVHVAKETVEVWSEWRDGRQPTISEKLEAMIYYAEQDSWLPTDEMKVVEIDPILARERFIAEHGGLGKEVCLWHGCSERRVNGLAFCFEHYFSRPSS